MSFFSPSIDVIAIAHSMSERGRLIDFVMSVIDGDESGYQFKGHFHKPGWTADIKPSAYIIRCKSKEHELHLRLKFKTLPSDELVNNCYHLAGGSYG